MLLANGSDHFCFISLPQDRRHERAGPDIDLREWVAPRNTVWHMSHMAKRRRPRFRTSLVESSLDAKWLSTVFSLIAGSVDAIGPNATKVILAGMLGVSAMAVQNALVQISLKGPQSTAAMTTNMTRFMMDVGDVMLERRPADVIQARDRAMRTWPAIVGFAIGCGLGAICEATIGLWSLALPAGLALLAVAMGMTADLEGGQGS